MGLVATEIIANVDSLVLITFDISSLTINVFACFKFFFYLTWRSTTVYPSQGLNEQELGALVEALKAASSTWRNAPDPPTLSSKDFIVPSVAHVAQAIRYVFECLHLVHRTHHKLSRIHFHYLVRTNTSIPLVIVISLSLSLTS